jgi:protein-S-isoprenylcysteine O-methyltransferase Ste14
MPRNEKITPLLVLQFCVVVIVISVVSFRPGEWSNARWVGLCIAIPAAVLLFVARWQLGTSFSVTPQARALVTHGVYAKVRNPIYVFSGLTLLGVLIALNSRYAFLLLAVVIPVQVIRAHQETNVLEARFGDEYRQYRKGTWF